MTAVRTDWGQNQRVYHVTGQAFATNDDRFREHRRFDGSGEPPDNGDMEKRVAKLEEIAEKTVERMVSLERSAALSLQKQDEFSKHYATKVDVADVRTAVADVKATVAASTTSIIKWVVGAVVFSQIIPVLATWLPKLLGPHP